ncbi:MAG: cytochrome c biogenesis protein CcsA [Phycisphaerae bacterium]|jgi:heme exporter protein C|nr:cytochrome c biogenesis protein CcsA [Phycisphaerae bacterium]
MLARSKTVVRIFWLVVLVAFVLTTTMLFTYTPKDADQGSIQKLFYVHLPAALNAFLACFIAFVGGLGYLWQRRMVWDHLSAAAAKVAALMCTVVLVTGIIWGRVAWGAWWTWSPRLTFSLMLWLLYVVYLIIRPAIESPERRATISAIYALAAFLDVPLVWLSVRLIPDHTHPGPVTIISSAMKLTLAAWFVPVTLLSVGLIVALFKSSSRQWARKQTQTDDSTWAVGGDEDATGA